MSQLLLGKISSVRRKHTLVSAGTGLAAGVSVFVGMLVLAAVADWLLDLPVAWRAAPLAVSAGTGLYLLARLALLPMLRGADDETLALAVERMVPAFASRLIAAVQFSRPNAVTAGESPALVRAMVAQTERFAAGVDFPAVIRADRLAKWSGAAAAVLLVTAGLFAYGGETSRVLLARAFLQRLPLPAKTKVEVLSGSFLVAQGERAELSARAVGWRPEAGTAEITYSSGRRQTVMLARSKEQRDLYTGAMDAVEEGFAYRVRLYDGVSESFAVRVEARPAVLTLNCVQIYPKYTGLGEVPRQPTDLILLAGSRLRVSILANKALAEDRPTGTGSAKPANRVELGHQEGIVALPAVALVRDRADPRRWSAEFALPEAMTGFSIHLTDEHGLESKNPPFYAVDLVPDRPPSIRITAPDRRDILVTTEATCTVGFVADDDYGLASLSLHYKIDEEAEQTIPLSIQTGQREIRGYYPWVISRLAPPSDKPSLEGCVIEFHVEARDANDISGPGVTDSEHYQLRVVSKADKQAELIARMAESFTTIHDVSDKQENAAAELGSLITEQPALTQPARLPAPPNLTQPGR